MKTNRLVLIITSISLIFSSCSIDAIRVTSDDEITFKTIDITDFNTIEIANDMNAYITFSDTEEHIEIEANENLHKYITAKKEGDKLIVKLKNNLNIRGAETLNVYITTNQIDAFKALADAKIYLQNTLITNSAEITVSADSYFTGEVDVNYLKVAAFADAKVDVYGYVNTLSTKLSADAKLEGYDLIVNNLKIDMAADCDANLTVLETIDIDAAADCVLRYKGDAIIIHQNLRVDSKIIKVN
ncbi:MAG: DUF2807 domain-containing protein [Algibacter sp.]